MLKELGDPWIGYILFLLMILTGFAIFFLFRWLFDPYAFFRSVKQDLKRFDKDIEKRTLLVHAMNLEGNFTAEFAKYLGGKNVIQILATEDRYPHDPSLMKYDVKKIDWKQHEKDFLAEFNLQESASRNKGTVKIHKFISFVAKALTLILLREMIKK